MGNGKFNNLFGGGFEGEPVLRGDDRFVLRLKRNAADAIGIAGRRCRHRAFPSSGKKVSRCGAMVGKAAIIGKVFQQPVMRVSVDDVLYAVVYHFIFIARGFLPDVLFNSYGGHIKFIVVPSGGGVAKKGKQRCAGFGFIGCEEQSRVCGWDEGRHGPSFVAEAHLAGFDVYADGLSARKFIERSSRRQFYPVFRGNLKGVPSASAGGVEGYVFKDVSFTVGVEEIWGEVFQC